MDLFGKKEEEKKEDATAGESSESSVEESSSSEGKYGEPCSLCGKAPTDKKWGGQFFHKKCFRQLRKGASRMI